MTFGHSNSDSCWVDPTSHHWTTTEVDATVVLLVGLHLWFHLTRRQAVLDRILEDCGTLVPHLLDEELLHSDVIWSGSLMT